MDGDRVLYIQRSFDEGGVQSIVRGTIGGRGWEETLLSGGALRRRAARSERWQ